MMIRFSLKTDDLHKFSLILGLIPYQEPIKEGHFIVNERVTKIYVICLCCYIVHNTLF